MYSYTSAGSTPSEPLPNTGRDVHELPALQYRPVLLSLQVHCTCTLRTWTAILQRCLNHNSGISCALYLWPTDISTVHSSFSDYCGYCSVRPCIKMNFIIFAVQLDRTLLLISGELGYAYACCVHSASVINGDGASRYQFI